MPYPPNATECAELFQELKELDSRYASEYAPRKYEIIHDLAEAHFYAARPYFQAGLDHPDPDYRWACISAVATHWEDKEDFLVRKLMNMAQHDIDDDVRLLAASSLGFLRVSEAEPLLRAISQSTSEEQGIIDAARRALIELRSPSP